MEIKIDLRHRAIDSKFFSRLVWQELFNYYRLHGGALDRMDSILCDLYILEKFFTFGNWEDKDLYWEVHFNSGYTGTTYYSPLPDHFVASDTEGYARIKRVVEEGKNEILITFF